MSDSDQGSYTGPFEAAGILRTQRHVLRKEYLPLYEAMVCFHVWYP
jgi:hypothetical protein